MHFRAFRVSNNEAMCGEVDAIHDRFIADAIGLDWEDVCPRLMKIGERMFVAMCEQDMMELTERPVTAVSFDDLGVPIVEARGDILILRPTIVDEHGRCDVFNPEPLTEDDVEYLRHQFVDVPNIFDNNVQALRIWWLA